MFAAGRNSSKDGNGNGESLNGSSDADIIAITDMADILSLDANDEYVNVEDVPPQKPHFLDYDAAPPSDMEESFCVVPSAQRVKKTISSTREVLGKTEKLKVDKKYERDGEISDCELVANGYTKKEFTQDDNTLHLDSGYRALEHSNLRKIAFTKPKHFLDENPIPPDYMVQHELREHRSLDRNFERQQQQQQQQHQKHQKQQQENDRPSVSPLSERKSSLDRAGNAAIASDVRLSRERIKSHAPSYAISRFLSSPCSSMPPSGLSQSARLPKGCAWTSEHFENNYDERSADLELDNLGPKVECVYSLLSMLGSNDPLDMSKKFFELSRTPETCATLRRSGCIPLLVQMMHSADAEDNVRKCASMALHNVVHSNPDDRAGRREAKVLRHLDQITDYCNFLKTLLQSGGEAIADDTDRHPLAAISSLMKVSFDEEHRHAMCELGALHIIPNLVQLDHAAHGPNQNIEKSSIESCNTKDGDTNNKATPNTNTEQGCNSLRRYALMALTNLTFGDEKNKAHLCSQKPFMEALVAQLDSAPDDLLQVTASVLRNLSWRADNSMKSVLNEIGTVTALARAAMKNKNENTLKAILSALWNLSAHCSTNKAEFCSVDGALAFLVDMLTYEGPSKTLKIIENAGGILRNVSSHIAVRENYRQILRERNCLAILLQQLKSESLTVVSNSCGTLWNLSARCPEDQKFLWDNGAVPMLRSLIHSKHAMISEGSSSALKNLLNFRPTAHNHTQLDPIARSMGLKKLPTLNARKQRALEQELGAKVHSETCENLDVLVNVGIDDSFSKENNDDDDRNPILHRHPLSAPASTTATNCRLTRSAMLTKSESRDSIFSAKSDSAYENLLRSHSASDANRAKMKSKFTNYNPQRMVYAIQQKNTVDDVEQPINYSIKYNETTSTSTSTSTCKPIRETKIENGRSVGATGLYSTYQETDLDQPTDFSLRYPENQTESDADLLPHARKISEKAKETAITESSSTTSNTATGANNEVLLILEDTVKCYQTEDTPYIISNAASITDLRQNIGKCETLGGSIKNSAVALTENEGSNGNRPVIESSRNNQISGSYTPEKPINYCEEGTPGYFSRYDSLSSLDDSPATNRTAGLTAENAKNNFGQNHSLPDRKAPTLTASTSQKPELINSSNRSPKTVDNPASKVPTAATSNINSAQETPLMFSRHSSMDSLIAADDDDEDDVVQCDDKSSVVSDFSRLASGVISPSEIPDSPTQSMPQSPGRNITASDSVSPINARSSGLGLAAVRRPALRSVFEDDLNTFHVENTPAEFSCATSLSNLSIVDENTGCTLAAQTNGDDQKLLKTVEETIVVASEGEEESNTNNDDILLASCINMGMHRSKASKPENQLTTFHEATKQYCTEDTPALLSKVGSNSNLSAISICSSNSHLDNASAEASAKQTVQRQSLNLSDDVSSNASESGAGIGQSILEECIRDGMKKTQSNRRDPAAFNDPLEMMRRGGSALPQYLPVSDEVNKYLIEDSPCNFSVVSGLSNLTVGSSLVGPAIQLADNNDGAQKPQLKSQAKNQKSSGDVVPAERQEQWQDDSLSSLSIESEDDTNLLSQAIAAGCNRPKSNLGFASKTSASGGSKRSNSLSASQPIPIKHGNDAAHHSSDRRNSSRRAVESNMNGNESFSSVDSSDSNDNQSKSLLELCILTGMHKSRENSSRSRNQRTPLGSAALNTTSTQSNPNLKQFDSLPSQLNVPHAFAPRQKHSANSTSNRLRDRERKDEKLLLECINTGISKKINGSGNTPTPLNIENRLLGIVGSECAMVNCVQLNPKNVQATSAAATNVVGEVVELSRVNTTITAAAATDVEKTQQQHLYKLETSTNINNRNNNNKIFKDILDDTIEDRKDLATTTMIHREVAVLEDENLHSHVNICKKMNDIGSNEKDDKSSDESNESFIIETTVSLLEQQSQPITNSSSAVNEKHKDPDLMLKSVERLTMEFVSSAEHFLTLNSENGETKRKDSTSNNTWNEDTHPNDVSFPSVSVTAPIIADSLTCDDDDDDNDELATQADHKELNDFAEITPTNDEQPQPSLLCLIGDEIDMYAASSLTPQLNSLEAETETLKNDDNQSLHDNNHSNSINFKLGGAVQTAAISGTSRHFSYSHSLSHGMTNSTLIANEARTIAENLLKLNNDEEYEELTFSLNSLDLDNIRPPSGMESLNASGYYHHEYLQNTTQPNSIQRLAHAPRSPQLCAKSPKFPRKALPAGLMARRALGHFTGSAESVNSSVNLLDNIKPPSLMDELLDSMISVSSLQSEIADCCESMATTVSASNYETATGVDTDTGNLSNCENEIDDNTITLHSCCDMLPCDDITLDNYSSAESTPGKSPDLSDKNSLTPKMKRKLSKDRFKTYTIAARELPHAQANALAQDEDEMLQIEIVETTPTPREVNSASARRRRSSQDRYKTQTIVYPVTQRSTVEPMELFIDEAALNSLNSTDDCLSDDVSSIRAMTTKFTHIPETDLPADDYNSIECEQQNSETESCNGEIVQSNVLNEKAIIEEDKQIQQVKAVRGRKKAPYVSPYSMQYQRSNTAPVARLSTNKTGNTGNVLQKRNSNSSTSCIDKTSPLKKKNIIAPKTQTPPTLERQGTFIKDEPTLANKDMPIVEALSPTASPQIKSANNSNQSSPKRSAVSRLPTKRKTASVPSSSNTSRISAVRKMPQIPTRPQRSNSNTNIRTANAVAVSVARNAALSARVSSTTPPSRSNSILNTTDNSANKMNQTQSRVAGIWKKSSIGQGNVKQIGSTATATARTSSILKTQHTKSTTTINTQKQQHETQLVRSSTFDNSPVKTGIQKAAKTTMPSKSVRSAHTTGTKFAIHKNLINNTGRNESRCVRK